MAHIELPALRGHDPLGFLAALGVHRLVVEELGDRDAVLGWSNGPMSPAIVSTAVAESTGELAEQLRGVAAQAWEGDQVMPGVDGFPPPKEGMAGSDPLRGLSAIEARVLAERARAASDGGDRRLEQWLVGTVAPAVIIESTKTTGDVVPASAFHVWPTGQVTVDRTFSKAREGAMERDAIQRALVRWSRFTKKGQDTDSSGAYLDHRAIQDEYIGQHTSGSMKNRGEPGATWLALMSYPYFPVLARPGQGGTTGWHRGPGRRARTELVWPVWDEPLGVAAIEATLSHPAIPRVFSDHLQAADAAASGRRPRRPRRFGSAKPPAFVAAVYHSRRLPGPKGSGPLGPAQRCWTRNGG